MNSQPTNQSREGAAIVALVMVAFFGLLAWWRYQEKQFEDRPPSQAGAVASRPKPSRVPQTDAARRASDEGRSVGAAAKGWKVPSPEVLGKIAGIHAEKAKTAELTAWKRGFVEGYVGAFHGQR